MSIRALLEEVASGHITSDAALPRLRAAMEADIGFARLDLDRKDRCGFPEVIFCEGKTPGQTARIAAVMAGHGSGVLGTRASKEHFAAVQKVRPAAQYHETARCITIAPATPPIPVGHIAVLAAGTSDMPVAEEAAVTAECMGARVARIFDVGVAGLHRLMRHLPALREARAVIAVAGMEGALPSVVAGLVAAPVIGVPTSVGYGASFQGLASLLAMLNSCAPGVTVVNIDNGFGAGMAAAKINRIGEAGYANSSV